MTCLVHSVFWDLYCAAPERRETCDHSSEAKAFHDYVSSAYMGTVAHILLKKTATLLSRLRSGVNNGLSTRVVQEIFLSLDLSEQSTRNLCFSTLKSWQSPTFSFKNDTASGYCDSLLARRMIMIHPEILSLWFLHFSALFSMFGTFFFRYVSNLVLPTAPFYSCILTT